MGIPSLSIIFHGGEPMLQKPEKFAKMCEVIRGVMPPTLRLSLLIQTNATLITETWLQTLKDWGVEIGVSIDGPPEVNDKFRVDHQGRGTYDRVREGISRAIAFSKENNTNSPGAISVINADHDYVHIVEHLVDAIGLDRVNFLLPDCSYEDGIPNGHTAEAYGQKLCEIFDAAIARPNVWIRQVEELLSHFQIKSESEAPVKTSGRAQIIIVQSDGSISIDDTFIPAKNWRTKLPTYHSKNVSLIEYLSLPIFDEIEQAYENFPAECQNCLWQPICRGGALENRYSVERDFDNPSIFCAGLKIYFTHVVRYLVQNGYPKEKIREILIPNEDLTLAGSQYGG